MSKSYDNTVPHKFTTYIIKEGKREKYRSKRAEDATQKINPTEIEEKVNALVNIISEGAAEISTKLSDCIAEDTTSSIIIQGVNMEAPINDLKTQVEAMKDNVTTVGAEYIEAARRIHDSLQGEANDAAKAYVITGASSYELEVN